MNGGQYLMLFMVALLLLWLAEDPAKTEFRQFSLIMLLLLLCPLSVRALCLYQTAFYREENLWELLPVTPLLAYGLVAAFSKMTTAMTRGYGRWKSAASKTKERFCEGVVLTVLAALLFLCGTHSLARSVTAQTKGGERIPAEPYEVLSLIEIPQEGTVFLLAPDEVLTYARIYDGAIMLPYGRNLWEAELSAYTYDTYSADMYELHDWINGFNIPMEGRLVWEEEFLSRCASTGYEYLVFSVEREGGAELKKALSGQKEYMPETRTDEYVIYRLH